MTSGPVLNNPIPILSVNSGDSSLNSQILGGSGKPFVGVVGHGQSDLQIVVVDSAVVKVCLKDRDWLSPGARTNLAGHSLLIWTLGS